jgi:hypothetical protein
LSDEFKRFKGDEKKKSKDMSKEYQDVLDKWITLQSNQEFAQFTVEGIDKLLKKDSKITEELEQEKPKKYADLYQGMAEIYDFKPVIFRDVKVGNAGFIGRALRNRNNGLCSNWKQIRKKAIEYRDKSDSINTLLKQKEKALIVTDNVDLKKLERPEVPIIQKYDLPLEDRDIDYSINSVVNNHSDDIADKLKNALSKLEKGPKEHIKKQSTISSIGSAIKKRLGFGPCK